MDWTRDPNGGQAELAQPLPAAEPVGYLVRNDFDWPVWVCGSLSLDDVFDIASGMYLEGDKRP
ncbi:hypothetical protein [Actinokineospora diospyrosa]|uniref:Uncharacterized protein n=1 Tax=Actinokineospora diospyrosa TaxID=103728 RepID=A0ABT1IB60_9PSEU|nr:hypothetical protein [Actinokineospora diospyrosa]MCP2269877.1 hypothetical protein [Actinokineospora diospyrosa]